MLLLQYIREREIFDIERQTLIIVHPEHIDLLCNRLQTPLQFAHTLLLVRIRLNDVRDQILADPHAFLQIHLAQSSRKQVLLSNHLLLLGTISLQLYDHHTVQQDSVQLVDIIRREHEHHFAQVDRNAGQVLVLKLAVLYGIRQMHKQVLYFLALRRRGNLVQLIKEQHCAHRFRRTKTIHDLP